MMVDINSPAVVLNNIIMNISFSCCQKLTRSFWKSQKVIYSKFCKSCKIWMTCIFNYLIKANLAYLVFTVLVFMDSFFLLFGFTSRTRQGWTLVWRENFCFSSCQTYDTFFTFLWLNWLIWTNMICRFKSIELLSFTLRNQIQIVLAAAVH